MKIDLDELIEIHQLIITIISSAIIVIANFTIQQRGGEHNDTVIFLYEEDGYSYTITVEKDRKLDS